MVKLHWTNFWFYQKKSLHNFPDLFTSLLKAKKWTYLLLNKGLLTILKNSFENSEKNFREIVTKSILGILKINEQINLCKKFQKFVKLLSHKNFFLNVNKKGICFIWARLKSQKAELKQRIYVSWAKYLDMFCHDCSYNNKRFSPIQNPHIIRISMNQNIPSTPLRSSNFSFSVEGLSNLFAR